MAWLLTANCLHSLSAFIVLGRTIYLGPDPTTCSHVCFYRSTDTDQSLEEACMSPHLFPLLHSPLSFAVHTFRHETNLQSLPFIRQWNWYQKGSVNNKKDKNICFQGTSIPVRTNAEINKKIKKIILDSSKLRKKPQDNVMESDLGIGEPHGKPMDGLSGQMTLYLKHEGKEDSGIA